jgi:hypothetical protein
MDNKMLKVYDSSDKAVDALVRLAHALDEEGHYSQLLVMVRALYVLLLCFLKDVRDVEVTGQSVEQDEKG